NDVSIDGRGPISASAAYWPETRRAQLERRNGSRDWLIHVTVGPPAPSLSDWRNPCVAGNPKQLVVVAEAPKFWFNPTVRDCLYPEQHKCRTTSPRRSTLRRSS